MVCPWCLPWVASSLPDLHCCAVNTFLTLLQGPDDAAAAAALVFLSPAEPVQAVPVDQPNTDRKKKPTHPDQVLDSHELGLLTLDIFKRLCISVPLYVTQASQHKAKNAHSRQTGCTMTYDGSRLQRHGTRQPAKFITTDPGLHLTCGTICKLFHGLR